MRGYLKTRVWDWLLCCFISFGLTMNMFSGFVLTDWFSANMGCVAAALAVVLLVAAALVQEGGAARCARARGQPIQAHVQGACRSGL